MILLTIFIIVGVIATSLLWVGSIFLQGWLYNDLTPQIPLKALISGALLSLFLTGWASIYQTDPGKIDTLFNFSREQLVGSYDEYLSIRRVGDNERDPVKYVRKPGGRGYTDDFVSETHRKAWSRSDSDGMMIAILIQEKGKDQPTRFDAKLEPNGNFPREGLRFYEREGKRYMDAVTLGKIYRVRPWAIVLNLLANGLHLLVWIVILSLGMRFTFGHASGIGFIAWLITMCFGLPALFAQVAP